jgi:RNA polymerase sigma-70 factor (ECF subfamily)
VEQLSADATDDELMERLQKGDTGALAPLYVRYRGVVNAVVRRRTPGLEDGEAEDICHEVFLTLKDIAHRYRRGDTLKGWLCGIALRKARRASEGRQSRQGLLTRLFKPNAPVEVMPAELRGDVDRVLALLPEAQREVVVLSLIQQLDTEDVAKALGISVNTVWTRLHRARHRIRELMDDEGAS